MKNLFVGTALVLTISACSSSSTTTDAGAASSGIVAGAADAHCTKATPVDPAACTGAADAGTTDMDAGGGTSEYGATLFNAEGDDDDCKYHVKWSSPTGVAQKANVSFTVVLTTKADGKPATGAPVRAEVFLDDTHPGPNTKQVSTETSSGTYSVGPIQCDAPGRWTVRFHFHEECDDGEHSPHGHAAFYVQVP